MSARLFTLVFASLALIAIALLAVDGRLFTPDGVVPSEVATERSQWKALHISAYTMRVERRCLCDIRPLVVTVTGGRPEESHFETASGPKPLGDADRAHQPLNVEMLFERLDRAYIDRYAKVQVTYDPALHYPAKIFFDRSATTFDDEVWYETKVQPSTNGG